MTRDYGLLDVTTEELRAELHKRDEQARKERHVQLCAAYPCPECGGDPVTVEQSLAEEYRFAPRDSDGHPMLYMPYEMGTTQGGRWETRVTCVNDHVTITDEVKWPVR